MKARSAVFLNSQWETLQAAFGSRLQRDVPLAPYTAARIGGPADALLTADSVDELADTAVKLLEMRIPFFILGGGSNILVSDDGVRGLVVLNRAKETRLEEAADPPTIWAGSGASFGQLARKVSAKGLSGLEWATGVPGTVGGAVFGNAGAHSSDVANNLRVAEILHQDGRREEWPVEKMEYAYRTSALKRQSQNVVILSATFELAHSTVEQTRTLVETFSAHRHQTQPPGASMGSMFKNPPNDYAGRLIEAAGLKGTRIGSAEISPVHANFFVSNGRTRAADILELIKLTQNKVLDKFGIDLKLEIELIGEWN
jgi:UDP-N-acetylmuramate dehydrogenase